MSKKVILSVLSAFALLSTTQAAYKSGFYIGANAGGTYDYHKVDTKASSLGESLIKQVFEHGAMQRGLFYFHLL